MKPKISEISSLRFVAVLLVLLFHLNPNKFPGGYIGVDIFFVISGYVISLKIFDNGINKYEFNIFEFYARRFRRLMPPFLILVFLCLILGFIIFLPFSYNFHIYSYLSSITFSSNILFWRKIDYFLSDQILNPFLHTWSLSLEWQFYLIFPILIYLIKRIDQKYISLFFVLLILSSLSLSVFVNKAGMFSFSFYNLPTRIFEFVIGVLFSFYFSLKKLDGLNKKPVKLFLLAFTLSIFFTQLFFNYLSPYFPHLSSFFLSIITGCLIYSFSDGLPISKIFNCNLFNFFGDISYSVYLWHYPIILFVNYYFLNDTNLYIIYFIILIGTLLLSIASYFYIEKNTAFWNSKKTIGVYLIFLFLGVVLITFQDRVITFFENKIDSNHIVYNKIKLSSDISHLKNTFQSPSSVANRYSFDFEKLILQRYNPQNTIVVFGDSHAINLYNALAKSIHAKNYNIVGIVSGGCSLTFQNKDCEISAILNFLTKNHFRAVFYTEASFRLFLNKEVQSDRGIFFNTNLISDLKVDKLKVKKILSTLDDLGENVFFVSPWPEYFVRNNTRDYLKIYSKNISPEIISKMKELDSEFRYDLIKNKYKLKYINTLQFWGNNSINDNGYSKYCDFDHLSIYGEYFLSSNLNKVNF